MNEKKSESVVREIKRKTLQMRHQPNLGNAKCVSSFLAPNVQKALNRYTHASHGGNTPYEVLRAKLESNFQCQP